MNPPRIDRAVAALKEILHGRSEVESAILYGSCAKGTAREDSDIDVLVLVSEGSAARLREEIHDIESEFDVNVSSMVLRPQEIDQLDRQFLDTVLREGIPLAGQLPEVSIQDLQLRPLRLVSFDLSHLAPPQKMRLYRLLDGYVTVKRRGRKRYEHRVDGFLKEVGGWRIGRGAIVVPEAAAPRLEEILSNANAKRWTIAAWAQPF